MSNRHIIPVALAIVALLVPGTADAQFNTGLKDWFGHLAAGYSATQGNTSDLLSSGWNISGGATYKPGGWPLGIIIDLGYNDFGISRQALDAAQSLRGDASIWSLTTGAIWALKTGGLVGFNLQAGAGGYYSQGHLSESGTVVDDSVSSFNFGFNLGAAVTFRLPSNSVVFLGARLHWVDTREAMRFTPIVAGFRW